jgi:hypothetical protein
LGSTIDYGLKQKRAMGTGQHWLPEVDHERAESKNSNDKACRTEDLPPIEPV